MTLGQNPNPHQPRLGYGLEPEPEAIRDTCTIDSLPRLPAAAKACSECPWRKSNADREHFNNQYSTQEFTRLWRSIAVDGKFFGCHLFDADVHPVPSESLAMGYQKPADIGARRECAGMVAVIRRELRIVANYEDHEKYLEARPAGLSRKAFQQLKQRINGDLLPELRFASDEDESDVADPMERVDQTSWEWLLSGEGQVDLLVTLEAINGSTCECPVCTNHAVVHPSKELKLPDGTTVPVDQELHELLAGMVDAGIQTVDSCIDMAEALDRLWPDRKSALLRAPAGKLNYRNMIMQRAAHIRFNNTSMPAKAFQGAAEKTYGVEVSVSGIMTQIVFQPAHIDRKSVV